MRTTGRTDGFVLSARDYDLLRQLAREEYRNATPEQFDELLWEVFDGMTPEQIESFWDTLKSVGKTVLRVGQRALPGVISGATTGAAAGGPWGALLGGLAGGVRSAMRAPQPGQAPRPTPRPAPPAGAAPSRPAGGPAAAQLLQLIQSPQLLQSLLSLIMGGAGARTVPAGRSETAVPPAAFVTALAELAERASVEAAELQARESTPAYLLDEEGEPVCDPASREERTNRLLDLLQEDQASGSRARMIPQHEAVADWMEEASLIEEESTFEWDD